LNNRIDANNNKPTFKEKYEQELLRHQQLTKRWMTIGKTETLSYELLFKDFWGEVHSPNITDDFY
jgi:hypothetical protein